MSASWLGLSGQIHWHLDDTIVALSSAPGPGARAIVRLSGPRTWDIVRRVVRADPALPSTPAAGVFATRWHPASGPTGVAVTLHTFVAPRSYTGQDLAELHLISAPPVVEALVQAILECGARLAQSGEFTLRAFLHGKLDLTQADGLLALFTSRSYDSLRRAVKQLAGDLAHPLALLRDNLLDLCADVEASLDFTDQDIASIQPGEACRRVEALLRRVTALLAQLEERALGDDAAKVVLAGLPNAGKSSLFNALAGQNLALISPWPGTTRDYLTARVEWEGCVLELVDTAGLEDDPADPSLAAVHTQAQQLRQLQWSEADLILYCVSLEDHGPKSSLADEHRLHRQRVIEVWTKSDLLPAADLEAVVRRAQHTGAVVTSARNGAGLPELRQRIVATLQALARDDTLELSAARCRASLQETARALSEARSLLLHAAPLELAAAELRCAAEALGHVTGAVFTEDILDRTFSRFCIGK